MEVTVNIDQEKGWADLPEEMRRSIREYRKDPRNRQGDIGAWLCRVWARFRLGELDTLRLEYDGVSVGTAQLVKLPEAGGLNLRLQIQGRSSGPLDVPMETVQNFDYHR